jgi:NAD(P)-dependent dehydrogenase (short-subunit alcohol dehydrogenase family)
MFKYLKEYQIKDMRDMLKNNKAPQHQTSASLHNKVAVIAGATSGVGLAAAEELARFNCRLVIIARNEQKVNQVKANLEARFDCRVTYFLADFTLPEEVHSVATQIAGETDRIDILINSAGIFSTTKHYTKDGFESVFCVNHLAPFILTYRLIPKLKRNYSAQT